MTPIDQPKTCGSCKFGKRVDITQVECRGVPPTPVVAGQQRNALGQVNMAIQLLRPVLPAQEQACALYQFMAQIIDLGRAPAAGEGLDGRRN